jgi:Predicted pPIWI-associating nuclease
MMPDQELVERVRRRLPDDFSIRQLDGALKVLTQEDNPARANQSASSFRELTAHELESMAPTADVMRCPWFKQDKNVEGPTRRQRALYTCRGGLTDEFLKSKLGIKPSELHKGLGDAFQELNKRTHVRPDTELKSEQEIDEFADAALVALDDLFVTIDEIREKVASALSRELNDEATGAFINQTIDELAIISGRYSTEGLLIDGAEVVSLDIDAIRYRFTGSVNVSLMAGGRGDSVEFNESFPFECTTSAAASAPAAFDSDDTEINVDTSSWTGEDE